MARSNNQSGSTSKAQRSALENLKYEVANEVGVNLKQGYNGDITSRDAGKIGGGITRRVISEEKNGMGS